MKEVREKRRGNVYEISIFQTKKPRVVSTKIQLLLVLMSFVSSLFVALSMAEGTEVHMHGRNLRCERRE